jgi:hypothetical protein
MGQPCYPIETLPQQYDVVWCLYPESGITPGPIVRPSLVLDVRINEKEQLGAVICTYGTGVFDQSHAKGDLIIPSGEIAALGLHKPTRFALSLNSRMQLIWGPRYFVGQTYMKAMQIKIGSLNDDQIARVIAGLKHRGLQPYA